MKRNLLIIGFVLIGISSIFISYTLLAGPLIYTKFADVEWGVEAISYANRWDDGPVIESFIFDEGKILNINFTFRFNDSKLLDFFILDQENYMKWETNQTANKYLLTRAVNSLDVNWTTPYDSKWYFVWDTTPYDPTVLGLRIKLVHYEILPFGDKIIVDNRPFLLLNLFILETAIVIIAYNLFNERNY